MIRGLPDTARLWGWMNGGPEFVGWGIDRHIRASTYDAVNTNTVATGNFKKKPKVDPWPRPKKKSKKKRSVRDLHKQMLERQAKLLG